MTGCAPEADRAKVLNAVQTPSRIAGLVGLLIALSTLGGCVLAELDLQGRGCPCIEGYVCVAEVCVPEGTVADDAGADDAAVDAGPEDGSVAVDMGVAEAGTDAGPVDAIADGGMPDTGPDAGPADADPMDAQPEDSGLDAGPPDTGPMMIPCTSDRHCSAPNLVCEAGFCAAGCNAGGPACTGGLTCDTQSGHCFNGAAACVLDSDCGSGPPVGVCVGGACRYGCAVGDSQCTGDRRCAASGFCSVAPECISTSDCGQVDFICQSGACVRRCDQPGAFACNGNSTCNATSGMCEGAVAVGQDCTADNQCISGQCLSLTSPSTQSFCTRACGATSDCPLTTSCLTVNGAKLCVRANVFSPRPQMDVMSSLACSDPGNACQSLICDSSACVERCTQDEHCEAFGTQCITTVITGGAGVIFQECAGPVGAGAPGDVCPNDDDSLCQSGVCNRYLNRCAGGCCSDSSCDPTQSCLVYDIAADSPWTTCQARSGSAGTKGYGEACAASSECDAENCAPRDPNNLGGAKSCTTHCCSDLDCDGYPGGARCAPMPAAGVAALVKYCVPLVP